MPSTAVRNIAYDAETRTLLVTFVTSGRRYAYRDVPLLEYEGLRHAFSKGRHFNAYIRDRYPCELVFDPPGGPSPTSSTIAKL